MAPPHFLRRSAPCRVGIGAQIKGKFKFVKIIKLWNCYLYHTITCTRISTKSGGQALSRLPKFPAFFWRFLQSESVFARFSAAAGPARGFFIKAINLWGQGEISTERQRAERAFVGADARHCARRRVSEANRRAAAALRPEIGPGALWQPVRARDDASVVPYRARVARRSNICIGPIRPPCQRGLAAAKGRRLGDCVWVICRL